MHGFGLTASGLGLRFRDKDLELGLKARKFGSGICGSLRRILQELS